MIYFEALCVVWGLIEDAVSDRAALAACHAGADASATHSMLVLRQCWVFAC